MKQALQRAAATRLEPDYRTSRWSRWLKQVDVGNQISSGDTTGIVVSPRRILSI